MNTIVKQNLKNGCQILRIIILTMVLAAISASKAYILLAAPSTYSQKVQVDMVEAPFIEWDKTFGGKERDGLSEIIVTSDGGYLLAGSSASNISEDKSENSKGGNDFWIVKIDADGNKVWDRSYGGENSEYFYSILVTSDGGFLLFGDSSSDASGDKSENNIDGYDYWVIKIDADGNKVWDKTFNSKEYDSPSVLIYSSDGGYLLGGSSESLISASDYWVIKIDADGNKIWEKTFGGWSTDHLSSITQSSDGSYFLAGSSESSDTDDKSEVGNGEYDYWVIKIDANGNKVWDKSYGGEGSEYLHNMTATSDGNYLLFGDSNSDASGDKSEINIGGRDFWIIKIDADGNKIWDKSYGGEGTEYSNNMVALSDGGYLLTGSSESLVSSFDYFTVKIDANGNKVWGKSYGGESREHLYSALITSDGGYMLSGLSESNAAGEKSEDNNGENDFWAIKIDADGNKVWDKTMGGNGIDYFSSLVIAPNGGYLLGGTSDSDASGSKSEDSKGGNDIWIVKLVESPTSVITGFTLMNAAKDLEIRELVDGDIISITEIASGMLSIQANILSENVESVEFSLQGPISHHQNENSPPYALFGDNQGDFKGLEWRPGQYTLTATPYLDAKKGTPLTISFEVVQEDITPVPFIEWDKTLGAGGKEDLHQVILTDDDGYLLAGTSNSEASGDKSEPGKGEYDFWVIKVNENGEKVWDKTFGGETEGYDYLRSAITTPDGGYLLSGFIDVDKSYNIFEDTNQDYWIIKMDADGNKIWDKTFDYGDSDDALKIIASADGGYLVAGITTSYNYSESDFLLIKIDENGNKIWDKLFSCNGYNLLESAILTSDGGYLLGGSSEANASGDKSEDSKGGFDYWAIKIDADGNKIWDRTFGGISEESLNSVSNAQDGGYLLGGTSYGEASGDRSEDTKGGSTDYWIIKVDTDGNKIWDKVIGGSSYDVLEKIILTHDGGYLLAGSSKSDISGDKSENSKGEHDYWIVKIDADGRKIWDKTVGGHENEFLYSAILTPDGDMLLGGNSNSDASGDKSENSKGEDDYWIVKISNPDIPVIIGFTLINAAKNLKIRDLKDGDVIPTTEVASGLFSIRANASSGNVERLEFSLQGPITHFQEETSAPYALFGDNEGNFKGITWIPGQYTLTATPYGNGTSGTPHTVTFTFIDSNEEAAMRIKVFPVPSSGVINIQHEKATNPATLMLLDFSGGILLQQPMSQQPVEQLNLSGFRKGIYYLKVVSPESVQVIRLMLE